MCSTNQEILNLVIDGEITTIEQGTALMVEEAHALADQLNVSPEAALIILRTTLNGIITRLCPRQQAEQIRELYTIPKENA